MHTVTVHKHHTRGEPRFTTAYSQLSDKSFGPFGFVEAIQELRVTAGLSPMDARNLVLDASEKGLATCQVEGDADASCP